MATQINSEPSDAPQPRRVLCQHGGPIPRGEVIRDVRRRVKMRKTVSVQTCFFVVTIVGLLIAWRTDRHLLKLQVDLLEQQVAVSNPDWRTRRLAIENIEAELDVNFDPTKLQHLLFALSDQDPGVRMRALEVLEKLRLDARTMNLDPGTINSQPEFAFWVGVVNTARQQSNNWETIKHYVERLNRGVPDPPNPFE